MKKCVWWARTCHFDLWLSLTFLILDHWLLQCLSDKEDLDDNKFKASKACCMRMMILLQWDFSLSSLLPSFLILLLLILEYKLHHVYWFSRQASSQTDNEVYDREKDGKNDKINENNENRYVRNDLMQMMQRRLWGMWQQQERMKRWQWNQWQWWL